MRVPRMFSAALNSWAVLAPLLRMFTLKMPSPSMRTRLPHTEYTNGISKDDLQKIDYLFCNFALQGVGLYIQDLFPRHHRFPLEIDNSTKLPQYVADGIGYTFLPKSLIEEDLAAKRLRAIPLLDFEPPKVDSYYITRSPSTVPTDLEEELLADRSYGLQGDDHSRHDDDGQKDIK